MVAGLAWKQFVHERISHQSATSVRRRILALSLPRDRATQRADIREVSPDVAEAYAGCEDKTLMRDLNALVQLRLLARSDGGYMPAAESILALRPQRSIASIQ